MAGENATETEKIDAEAARLQWVALFRAECHITTSRFYSNLHTIGGAGAAGLAAASGGTAFTGYPIVAGSLAIGAAATSALITSIRPDEAAQAHLRDAKEFNHLAEQVDRFTRFSIGADGKPISGNGASSPASNRLGQLLAFIERQKEIEERSLAVPMRLTRKTGRFLRDQDGWYAPPYDEFVSWQRARLQARPRSRLLRVFTKPPKEPARPETGNGSPSS